MFMQVVKRYKSICIEQNTHISWEGIQKDWALGDKFL